MLTPIRTLCIRLKCYRHKIVGAHTAGHTAYWGLECLGAHSIYAGMLAGCLGALTIAIYFLENEEKTRHD